MTSKAPRPLLLPQNRKLRHLQGLYLRNLSFVAPKGRASDDVSLNKSSTKLDALREEGQHPLHASRSSESLHSARPRSRRRSTTLAGISPVTRQRKLQYMIESRVADAFFSLHADGEEEPVYISEVQERARVRLGPLRPKLSELTNLSCRTLTSSFSI
jgi:UV radiation resistance-associated gene protein